MSRYDVAVVGAGLAGISIAALVARAGKKVIVLDPSDRPGGAVAASEQDGFRFSSGPNAIYGFGPGGSLAALGAALGIVGEPSPNPARYQVALPDRRITISPSREETLVELRREFPREIDPIAALYRDADRIAQKGRASRISAYFTARRTAGAFLRGYRTSAEFRALLEMQAAYFFGRNIDSLPLDSLVLLLSSPPAEHPEGHSRIAEQIASALLDRKGSILWKEQWPEILVSGRRASGLKAADRTIEARKLVVNTAWRPEEQVLFLGIRETALPVRMEATVLCLFDYARPEDRCFLSISPRGVHAPAGMRSLCAVYPNADRMGASGELLLDRLQRIIPFLSDFIVTRISRDGTERLYSLPDVAAPKNNGPYVSGNLQFRGRLRNVLFLPDTSNSWPPFERAVLGLSAKMT